jgi:heptosyltransferase-2
MNLKKLENTFKKNSMKILSFFICVKKYEVIDITNVKNILIIRQHDQLGDMLCCTPLFRALRERFPDSYITLVSGIVNTKVVLDNPFLDEVIEYNRRILQKYYLLFDFIKKLRKRRYDFVVVPVTVSMSVTSDLIAFLSRSKYRIGVSSLNGINNQTGFLYNYTVSLDWRNLNVHQTKRNIDILKDFSIDTNNYSLVVGLSKKDIEYADNFYNKFHKEGKISIGIHPGAGKISNRWPATKLGELIDILLQRHNCEIFITEGPMDKEPVKYFYDNYFDRVTFICEKNIKNIKAEVAIINKLSIFITNDTGIMHLASTTDTSVISLFGPTDPLQWAPQRSKDKYLVGENGDICNISVNDVYLAIKNIIS